MLHWPPFPKGAYEIPEYTLTCYLYSGLTPVSVLKFVDFVSEGFKVYLSQGEKNEKTSCELQKIR